jgi:hypothetical protein
MENKQSNGRGIGFFGLLQVAFIVLKVAGVIRWSWLTVFSPAILYAALVLIILVLAAWSDEK